MSDLIDKIPADVKTIMTPILRRAFLLKNCDPACHCCGNAIKIRHAFKLAMIMEIQLNEEVYRDHMLCDKCTVLDYEIAKAAEDNYQSQQIASGAWGYSRFHKEQP